MYFLRQFKNLLLIPLLFSFTLSACQQEEPVDPEAPIQEPAPVADQHLVSAELLRSITKDEILLLTTLSPDYEQYNQWIEHGIDIYKLTYLTTYQGQTVEASGLVCLPHGQTEEAPLLAGMHGTILDKASAPSNFSNLKGRSQELFASMGFITVIPDYLGFGASEHIFHPYYDAYYTGKASADMLLAAKELLADSIPHTNDLYIAGYSEGGYASVATLKYLEENDTTFNLVATAAGAGGYDIMSMTENVLSQGSYVSPAYLVYVVYAYNMTNAWNRPLTDFFKEPYASRIPTYADGSYTIAQINAKLPRQVDELFTEKFLTEIAADTETAFSAALQENSIHHWAPQSPLRLYHEQDDEIVPISNSRITYRKMVDLGATETEDFFYDDPEANSHGTGFIPMYEMAIPWFISLKDARNNKGTEE